MELDLDTIQTVDHSIQTTKEQAYAANHTFHDTLEHAYYFLTQPVRKRLKEYKIPEDWIFIPVNKIIFYSFATEVPMYWDWPPPSDQRITLPRHLCSNYHGIMEGNLILTPEHAELHDRLQTAQNRRAITQAQLKHLKTIRDRFTDPYYKTPLNKYGVNANILTLNSPGSQEI